MRLVEIASVTPTGAAAVLVFRHARTAGDGAAIDDATLGRIARILPADELDDLIADARTTRADGAIGGTSALSAIADALDDRGVKRDALRRRR